MNRYVKPIALMVLAIAVAVNIAIAVGEHLDAPKVITPAWVPDSALRARVKDNENRAARECTALFDIEKVGHNGGEDNAIRLDVANHFLACYAHRQIALLDAAK